MSQAAEDLLGVAEPTRSTGTSPSSSCPPTPKARGRSSSWREIVNAGSGDGAPLRIVLRPVDEFGMRLFARLAPCGPALAHSFVLGD